MIKQVMICVVCIMLLSACDAGGGNSSNAVINSASGESYRPIDLETITETTTGMIISGAIDHNTGDVNGYWIRANRGQDSYRNIEIETRNGYLLRLTHRTGLPEGTYPINAMFDTPLGEADVAGGLLYLWSPDADQQFTQNPQGTMTIRYNGVDLLGTVTLTVENPAGDSVVIEGQFYTQESESAVRN